jgi:hypothetical protein
MSTETISSCFNQARSQKRTSGHTDIGLAIQGVLLSFATLLSLPALMIFLSLILLGRLCWWISILLALFQVVFNSWAIQDSWRFYVYLGVVEISLCLTIIWYAVLWPAPAA